MHKETFSLLQRILFLGVLFGVTVLFVWVLSPFLISIFWAIVLAIVLYPLYLRLLGKLRRPTLAALITMLVALLSIGIPLAYAASKTATEGLGLYHEVASGAIDVHALLSGPTAARALTLFGMTTEDVTTNVTSLAQDAASFVATQALTIGTTTANLFLHGAVILYLLFFFLRDGAALARYLQRLVPFGDEREQLLFNQFASTTRAVVKGTLIVAIVQGAIGAILFFIAGIGSPVLWGVVMAFCATIPAIGSFVVWLPAALILFALGQVWQALVVALGGLLIVGLIDNVLRPILVGRDIEMPDALVLVAILGGIVTFGVAGVIIGPVIGALFLSIWNLFGKDFSEELDQHG